MSWKLLASVAAAVLCLVDATSATQVAVPTPTPPPLSMRGRPLILLVHGRNQAAKEPAELNAEWFTALRRGWRELPGSFAIPQTDYRMVQYQTIYRNNVAVCPSDRERRIARFSKLQVEKDVANAKVAVAAQSRVFAEAQYKTLAQRPGGAKMAPDHEELYQGMIAARTAEGSARQEYAEANASFLSFEETSIYEEAKEDLDFTQLYANAWDAFKAGIAYVVGDTDAARKASLAFIIKDTERYVTKREFRCATNATLMSALRSARNEGRPVILVAHSMGGLVSMDALVSQDVANYDLPEAAFPLQRFISVGSQLGLERFMHELIYRTSGEGEKFKIPKAFSQWVNLRGTNDYVSPRNVRALYDYRGAPFSEFNITTTIGDPHDITGYLSNKATAAAIAYAWCHAWAAGSQPSNCSRIVDVQAGDGGATVAEFSVLPNFRSVIEPINGR